MPFRDDLDALEARHAALDAEVGAKTRERDAAKTLLDDARARARLPVLDNLRVASPCRADWSKMSGDDRVRACAECNQNVYNLSQMTRDEAETLIASRNGGRLCVRYYQRTDGTILLADCVVGKRKRRRRVVFAAGLAGVLAGVGAGAAYGTRATKVQLVDVPVEEHAIAGGIGSMPEPPPPVEEVGKVPPIEPTVMGQMTVPSTAPVEKMGRMHRSR